MNRELSAGRTVVIVTGASSGIGCETRLAFARAGARVVLAARNAARLAQLAVTQPDRLLAVPTDVTRDDEVANLVQRTVAVYGRIDILVNNAGIGLRALVADTRPVDAQRVMEVNFFGALRCIQAVLPVLRQQGTGQIVNVGSVLSLIATPRNSIYSASKFALRALSDSLRIELQPAGIGVVLVMPGYTDTPFFDNQLRAGGPVRISSIKGQSPQLVAQAIVRACRRQQREVVLTAAGKIGVLTKKFAPRWLDWALARSRHNP